MDSTEYTSTTSTVTEERHSPPIGCRPAWMVAWSRVGELTGAIKRQYESPVGNAKLVKRWAEEIMMQCEIIETTEQRFNEDNGE